MNKKKAIVKFTVICVLAVLGILACFVNFQVPFTTNRYVGFAGAIENKMGIDLRGGVLAIFETEAGATGAEIDATISRLERTITGKGYVEATVQRQGSDIRVEVPGMEQTDDLFKAIGEPAEIDMRTSSGEIFLTGEHISAVEYYQSPETFEHGVLLRFTDEGGELFRTKVKEAGVGGSISIYANGTQISAPTIQSTDAGLDNTTVITGADYTKESAENFKVQIESGLYEVSLITKQQSIIPATLGDNAVEAGLIAAVIGLVFIFVFMFLIYGDLGLLSNLSILIFTIFFLFALSIVPMVQLTLPGIAGIILSLGMAVDANVVIFERIKDEYKAGKRMGVAIETGFNKSIATIFDANITSIIAAAVLYLLGTGAIKGFAVVFFLGVVISMFCSLVITRSFAKLYLYINPNNAKRLKLKKDDELIARNTEKAAAPARRTRTLNR